VTVNSSGVTVTGTVTATTLSGAGSFTTVSASGNMSFNSGYGSAAVAYGCRAWVNFNGTGTVAIRGSGNVSSITDNGTGDYTINFSTALADANYCPVGMGIDVSGAQVIVRRGSTAQTTSACRVSSEQPGTSSADCSQVNVAIFR
jgi:hypothetical protein